MKPISKLVSFLAALALASCASTAPEVAGTDRAAGAVEVNALVKPGFSVYEKDGRYWIFKETDPQLATFRRDGDLAVHATFIGNGPNGRTMKAPDKDTCREYMAACPGFRTFLVDGRIWVFREGGPDLEEFERAGEPAECVTWPGRGPLRMTLRGPDSETLADYLEALTS